VTYILQAAGKNMKRITIIIAAITLLVVCFTVGYFVGRESLDPVINVQLQHPDGTASLTAAPGNNALMVNINTATVSQLCVLPGIGEVLAERIIEYRTEHGGFDHVGEIMNVPGIGEEKYSAISEYIFVQ